MSTFSKWSEMDVAAFNARHGPIKESAKHEGVELESELHRQIMEECKRRGWIAVHSRMDSPTTTQLGVPDFIVLAPNRVLLIEAKSRTGKRTPAQIGFAMMAERLGHACHEVRSLSQFLAIVNSGDTPQRRD